MGLRSLPPVVRGYLLTVEAAAAAALVTAFAIAHQPFRGLTAMLVLTACGCLHIEATRYAVQARAGQNRANQDLLSTWLFALVLLVAPGLAGTAPILVDLYGWLRLERDEPVKRVFTTATTSGAAVLAGAVYAGLGGGPLSTSGDGLWRTLLGVAAAGVLFVVVNTGLVAGVVLLVHPGMATRDVFAGEPLRIEGVTLALATVVAGCWVAVPALVPLVLPALLLVQRSLLHGELLREARTDAKTGLPHAVAWRQLTEKELIRCSTDGRTLTVLLVDIDLFKAVNDVHGHLVGDEVLLAVVRCLVGAVRTGDTVGRFGGEEFAVLLPSADVEQATTVAERLRREVASLRLDTDGRQIAVTVSVGGAVLGLHGRVVDELLASADGALYAAKAAGRNAVVMATGRSALPA